MLENVYPYITNDGSVGLYNALFDDIYHSTTGAYTEACEKFCLPADLNYYFENLDEIKVLDICYGIGYNTKSFLHFFLNFLCKNFLPSRNFQNIYNDKIYSDNIFSKICACDSHEQAKKIFINCVDTDKELFFLSPFFISDADKINKKQYLPTDKIKHYHENKITKIFKFEKIINYLIIQNLAKNYADFLENDDLEAFLSDKSYREIIDKRSKAFYRFLKMKNICKSSGMPFLSFVHNIYYHHVSKCHKSIVNALKNGIIDINYNAIDVRKFIVNDNTKYNLIFLDAFTPNKCPCLWTLDFFVQLYRCLDDDGQILTYSNSALVRNAFIQAGFYVGKIFNEREGRYTGTIAVKNKNFIKYQLTQDDLSLLKTRAGIVYRDENLNSLNEAIIARRDEEVNASPLMSSSMYAKLMKAGQNV